MVELGAQPVSSLYAHVPFCVRKCGYCPFYSEASDGKLLGRYVRALIRELEGVASGLRPRTVFFGGGTPTLLNLSQWEQILNAMERLGLLGAAEWTVECNPATLSFDKARLLRSAGVNRISMGVQSLNDPLLQRLGRVHSRAMVFKSFDILRQAGFENVNLDLMFAIPGQTLAVWRQTLQEAIALGSEHLSSYEVTYEEDTPLYGQLQAGQFAVDEDLACAMHEVLVERAAEAGFERYEIANFARPSFACQHNINYWRAGSFHGVGPSATSYVRGARTRNWSDTQRYCELIETGQPAVESREELAPLARAGEAAAFGLRMVAGWPFDEFRRRTGHDLREQWAGDMSRLVEQGWGRLSPDRFQLTPAGLRFADAAAQLFLR
jgi:oxygen-independent coproporphyrinogen-3 oxidase